MPFFIEVILISIFTNSAQEFPFPTALPNLIVFIYFIIFILIDIKWFLIVALICIFLMKLDVKHLFFSFFFTFKIIFFLFF